MIRNGFFILAWLAAICGSAHALSDASSPTKIPTYWGASAPGGNMTCPIPIPSQIGSNPGRASWTDGFPPLNFSPIASGGIPPAGADFNGALCQISQWTRWQNAGGPVFYDPTFSSAVGGYPNGAVIAQAASPNCVWLSTIDNNLSDPDTGGANWAGFCPATAASLVNADQTLSGGANVTSYNLGTVTSGTLQVDCGKGPLQSLIDGGTFTIAAPANDGSCMILLTNTSGAQIPTFSGFTTNGNTGEPLTNSNGSRFTISIWRIGGVSSWIAKALQ